MRWDNINTLCDIIRETSFAIHCYHHMGIWRKSMKTPSHTAYASKD